MNNVGISYPHAEYYESIDDQLIDDLININIQATNKARARLPSHPAALRAADPRLFDDGSSALGCGGPPASHRIMRDVAATGQQCHTTVDGMVLQAPSQYALPTCQRLRLRHAAGACGPQPALLGNTRDAVFGCGVCAA